MKTFIFFSAFILIFYLNNAQCQSHIVLQPGSEGKDSKAHSYWPDRNLGDDLGIYAWAWTFYGGNPASIRSYLEFDLSFLSVNAVILDARLSLYFYIGPEDPNVWQKGDNQAYLMKVTSEWDEHTITWNNQPMITAEHAVLLTASTSTDQDYPDIDVTQLIQDIVADPEHGHGLCMKLITEQEYRALCFASGDNPDEKLRPRLELTYIDCDPPTVSFTYQVEDRTVSFEPVSPNAQLWQWDFGDGYQSTLSNPVHTYDQKDIYYVCLHVEDTCGSADYCDSVKVCDDPTAGFIYTVEGLTVHFQDTSHWAYAFDWDFGDQYYSSLDSPWHSYDSAGQYTVCQRVWNTCSADTSCQVLTLAASGINDQKQHSFEVFPNPAKDYIIISSEFEKTVRISLMRSDGGEIKSLGHDFSLEPRVIIPVSELPEGIYFVRISFDRDDILKKIIRID